MWGCFRATPAPSKDEDVSAQLRQEKATLETENNRLQRLVEELEQSNNQLKDQSKASEAEVVAALKKMEEQIAKQVEDSQQLVLEVREAKAAAVAQEQRHEQERQRMALAHKTDRDRMAETQAKVQSLEQRVGRNQRERTRLMEQIKRRDQALSLARQVIDMVDKSGMLGSDGIPLFPPALSFPASPHEASTANTTPPSTAAANASLMAAAGVKRAAADPAALPPRASTLSGAPGGAAGTAKPNTPGYSTLHGSRKGPLRASDSMASMAPLDMGTPAAAVNLSHQQLMIHELRRSLPALQAALAKTQDEVLDTTSPPSKMRASRTSRGASSRGGDSSSDMDGALNSPREAPRRSSSNGEGALNPLWEPSAAFVADKQNSPAGSRTGSPVVGAVAAAVVTVTANHGTCDVRAGRTNTGESKKGGWAAQGLQSLVGIKEAAQAGVGRYGGSHRGSSSGGSSNGAADGKGHVAHPDQVQV